MNRRGPPAPGWLAQERIGASLEVAHEFETVSTVSKFTHLLS